MSTVDSNDLIERLTLGVATTLGKRSTSYQDSDECILHGSKLRNQSCIVLDTSLKLKRNFTY